MIIIGYLILAVIVMGFSIQLSNYVDIIDKRTSISGAFIGGVILAAITSLPELFTSISATALLGQPELVIGNILGSDIFNTAVLASLFLAFPKRFRRARIGASHNLALVLDVTEIAAGVISLVSSAGTLLKKGYAWLSGIKNLDIKTLSFSTIKSNLSNQNWKTMASARWQDIKKGAQAFTSILRSGSKAQIKTAVSTQFKFLLENFKKPHVKAWTGIKNMFQHRLIIRNDLQLSQCNTISNCICLGHTLQYALSKTLD